MKIRNIIVLYLSIIIFCSLLNCKRERVSNDANEINLMKNNKIINNRLTQINTWDYFQDDHDYPLDAEIVNEEIYIIKSTGKLYKFTTNREIQKVDIDISDFGEKLWGAKYVSKDKLLLIISDKKHKHYLVSYDCGKKKLNQINTTKEPEKIIYIDNGEIWYIGTDQTLSVYKNRINMVVFDEIDQVYINKKFITCRRENQLSNVGSKDIYMSDFKLIKWNKIYERTVLDVIGITYLNDLVLKYEEPIRENCPTRIFVKTLNGKESDLLQGNIGPVYMQDNYLLTLRITKNDDFVLDLYKFNM